MLVEWGDAILPVLPADYLEVRLALRRATTTTGCSRSRRSAAVGGPPPALGDVVEPWPPSSLRLREAGAASC